jgi:outer membrane protein OmpA-like peptidoglycan-associated protein
MRATGIRGYFRYAEGTVASKLVRRMDWEMASTGAHVPAGTDGNTGQDGEIIIEEYSLTGDKEGNLIYTSIGKATTMTARMFEIVAKLSAPYYTDEESFDMKPGGGRSFSGNTAHSDKNSSQMLRAPEKPTATVVELPDWTDGKVQEMIDEYKRRCVEGMAGKEATDRKQAMLKEIEVHQGELIKYLNNLHKENGEKKETLLLLSMWMKRKVTWESSVGSLGEKCFEIPVLPEDCSNFETYYKEHEKKYKKNVLTKVEGDRLKALMQDCLDKSNTAKVAITTAIGNLKSIPGWEKDDDIFPEVTSLNIQLTRLGVTIEDQEKRFKALSPECLAPVPLEIFFKADSNKIIEMDKVQMKEIATFLLQNPHLRIKLVANTSSSTESTPKTEVHITEDTPTDHIMPDDYIGSKTGKKDKEKLVDKNEMSEDDKKLTIGDLMITRGESVKKEFMNLGVPASQIKTEEGKCLGPGEKNRKVELSYY